MCGIGGWLGEPQIDKEALQRMIGRLAHRGPDGHDVRHFESAGLLHTRLKIIDLSHAGDQPLANEDGSVWTVYNGEIYNHLSLRADLEAKGHVFRGRCDTEVLPHLYEEYGEKMFERLRGMFAIAILDLARKRLLLARDRYGIKPLVYALQEDRVVFTSEISALREVPQVDDSPDPQAVADFSALLFIPAPLTLHRGIKALSPGEFLDCRFGADNRITSRLTRYHTFEIAPDLSLSLESAAARAERLIEAGVNRQLESDVPLGSLLSGGIDSSLVSAFAQQALPNGVQTFNVRFPEAAYDETAAATAVAASIGSRHTTLDLGNGASWDEVVALLRSAGQPFADTSLFAVDAISRAMRRHVTVALSGDGGDEGFGGYNAYWRLEGVVRLRRLPASFWRAAAPAAHRATASGHFRSTLPRTMRTLGARDDAAILQGLFGWLDEHQRDQLLREPASIQPTRRLFERQWRNELPPGSSAIERLSAHAVEVNIRVILANDFLPKVDIGSMRNSLEVRVPMLDEDLIDFGLTLPHRLRVHRKVGKRVLRAVAARRLPPEIAARPKQGFAVPVDRWLGRDFRVALADTMLGERSVVSQVLERRTYEPWVEAFCSDRSLQSLSRASIYQRVIMLLALETALSPLASSSSSSSSSS
jgi:asparagine synthase (glutamine-hydrolysing)